MTTIGSDELGKGIARISAWIDSSYGEIPQEVHARRRVDKLMEEVGEVGQALGGWFGENPRKGVTHTREDVLDELLDVALTALAAYEALTGNGGLSVEGLASKLAAVLTRAGLGPDRLSPAVDLRSCDVCDAEWEPDFFCARCCDTPVPVTVRTPKLMWSCDEREDQMEDREEDVYYSVCLNCCRCSATGGETRTSIPGNAFILDGSMWFTLESGNLGVMACDGERQRFFTPEALQRARKVSARCLGLMRLLSSVEGALIDFDAKGLSAAEFDALEEQAVRISALLDNFQEAFGDEAGGEA